MSQLEVDKIIPQSGTTLTIGDSGDTISIPSGVTLSNAGTNTFASATITGDLTVDTNTLYVDSTNNKVGIGTTTPNYLLDVEGTGSQFRINSTSGDAHIQLKVPDTTSLAYINFGDSGSINSGQIMYRNNGDSMAFSTNASEAMRIDSSGNFMVGTTSTSINDLGSKIYPSGAMSLTRSGNATLFLNRKTSEGSLIELYEDNIPLASIGIKSDDLFISSSSSNHSGLKFANNNIIVPTNNIGNANDNATDLGFSSNRFKDLYLGGGVYLGGTGSANYLDDYEEGTWTPSLSTAGGTLSVTYNTGATVGTYTKIGNVVYYVFYIRTTAFSGGTGSITFSGLPFSAISGRPGIGIASGERIDLGIESAVINPASSGSTFTILIKNSTGTGSSDNFNGLDASDWSNLNPTNLYGSGFYYTDA